MITLVGDIGGTRIKLGVVRDHEVMASSVIEARSQQGLSAQLPRIAERWRQMCEELGIALTDCQALGMAFPSLVDGTRVLAAYGKYDDAPKLDLAQWARQEFGLPLVLDNDARLALLGEWRVGAGRGSEDLALLMLGTGLGTAAVIQGQLLRGKHAQAGVLGGHTTVRAGGRACTCGNHGCAESEASAGVLTQLARSRPDFNASPLTRLPLIQYEDIFRLAAEGDPCASALRAHSLQIWSATLVNLIHAYDPERLIVGGGIMAGHAHFFSDLEQLVRANAHTPWGQVQIVAAQLGDRAALHGLSVLALEKVAGHP